jgi:hypothetical protein
MSSGRPFTFLRGQDLNAALFGNHAADGSESGALPWPPQAFRGRLGETPAAFSIFGCGGQDLNAALFGNTPPVGSGAARCLGPRNQFRGRLGETQPPFSFIAGPRTSQWLRPSLGSRPYRGLRGRPRAYLRQACGERRVSQPLAGSP